MITHRGRFHTAALDRLRVASAIVSARWRRTTDDGRMNDGLFIAGDDAGRAGEGSERSAED